MTRVNVKGNWGEDQGKLRFAVECEPSRPSQLQVNCIIEAAIFVTEDQDVLFKNYEEITEFLSVTLIFRLPWSLKTRG